MEYMAMGPVSATLGTPAPAVTSVSTASSLNTTPDQMGADVHFSCACVYRGSTCVMCHQMFCWKIGNNLKRKGTKGEEGREGEGRRGEGRRGKRSYRILEVTEDLGTMQ